MHTHTHTHRVTLCHTLRSNRRQPTDPDRCRQFSTEAEENGEAEQGEAVAFPEPLGLRDARRGYRAESGR